MRFTFWHVVCILLTLSCSAMALILKNSAYQAPKLIVFSFDAFRADYLHPELTPNLYRISRQGVHATQMSSVYVTKTFPNHQSIATGLYEDEHGIVSNYMYDFKLNGTFGYSTTASRWWDTGKAKPIWNVNEFFNQNRASGLMMWPGTGVSFDNHLPRYSRPYAKIVDWSQRIENIIEWLTDPNHPANLVLAYWNDPDSTAHRNGPFSNQVKEVLKKIDHIVGYLFDRLKQLSLDSETNLIFCSDHGMAEINEDRIVNLSDFVDSNLFDAYGTSPVLNLLVKDRTKINEVYTQLLSQQKGNHYTVYLPENIPPEYHYKNNHRLLDIIVEGDEGYEVIRSKNKEDETFFMKSLANKTVKPENNHMQTPKQEEEDNLNEVAKKSIDILELFRLGRHRQKHVWGNHGYNVKTKSMQPMFVAYGPAFNRHLQYDRPFENIDLYPLMCELLHIRSFDPHEDAKLCRSNGSLSRVKGMLKQLKYSGDTSSYESNALKLVFVLTLGFVVMLLCASAFTCIAGSKARARRRSELHHVDLSDDIIDIDIDFGPLIRQKRGTMDTFANRIEQIGLLSSKKKSFQDF